WTLMMAIGFAAYLLFTLDDIALVIEATPRPWKTAYGRMVIFELIAEFINIRTGIDCPRYIITASSLFFTGLVFLAALWWGRSLYIGGNTRHLDIFLLGTGIYCGTFVLGNN